MASGKHTIFGRVTPEQKRILVRALQDAGHKVCMTGDGVNDILALKASDCSVAMAQGSEAARNISDIVLGDNDFSHLPHIVAEGRKSINNLTRSASLFLVKTVYSVFIGAFCIFLPPYPFIPIQMSTSECCNHWNTFLYLGIGRKLPKSTRRVSQERFAQEYPCIHMLFLSNDYLYNH